MRQRFKNAEKSAVRSGLSSPHPDIIYLQILKKFIEAQNMNIHPQTESSIWPNLPLMAILTS
jgi:hypothetical protein